MRLVLRGWLVAGSPNTSTCVIINKSDLYESKELEKFEELKAIYEAIGYKVVLISALKSENLETLREILKDKISLIGGHSGVGKSTLINAIQPQLDIRT